MDLILWRHADADEGERDMARKLTPKGRKQAARMGKDVDDNPVYLASTIYNLQVTQERWPEVSFHATREHGQRIAQG